MKIDFSILSVNEYLIPEIIRDPIPEKYLFDEEDEFLYTAAVLDSFTTVKHLIDFLFQGNTQGDDVYRDNNIYVADLSKYRSRLINFEYLENNYSKWLELTGRENTMNEYGMLVDIAGHIRKGMAKKYLLMIVSNRLPGNSFIDNVNAEP